MIFCKIKKLRVSARLPEYKTEGAACMDIYADLEQEPHKSIVVHQGFTEAIPTGLSVEVLDGYVLEILPRSGLAVNDGITIPNAPGQVDSDYRGEVKVILQNHGRWPYTVKHGDRIAQCRIMEVPQVKWKLTGVLRETDRGEGGFGHTGT